MRCFFHSFSSPTLFVTVNRRANGSYIDPVHERIWTATAMPPTFRTSVPGVPDITGWWFQPLWKIWVSWDDYIPNIWENKTWQPNHQPDHISANLSPRVPKWSSTGLGVSTPGSIAWSSPSRSSTSMHLERHGAAELVTWWPFFLFFFRIRNQTKPSTSGSLGKKEWPVEKCRKVPKPTTKTRLCWATLWTQVKPIVSWGLRWPNVAAELGFFLTQPSWA